MARCVRLHRLAAVVQDLLAVDHQDGVALHEIVDLLAQPQRVDVAVLDILVGAGRLELGRHAVGQRLAPVLEAVGIDLALHAGENLIEHASAVADDADVDLAGRGGDLRGVDVDAGDPGRSALKRGGAAWLMM